MKINTKIRYGLRTMIEIAINSENNGILQKDIAVNQGLSEKYLDPIIAALKKAELIENFKGKKSGYILKKPASDINVLMIHNAFEEDVVIVDCVGNHVICQKKDTCPTRFLWNGLNNTVKNYLRSWTLSDLVVKYKENNKNINEQVMFYI